MKKDRVIAENVLTFLEKTSEEYARKKKAEFFEYIQVSLHDDGMSSPIEDLFFTAFCAQVEAEGHALNPWFVRGNNGELLDGAGVFIKPQYKVGNFRADFLIYQNEISKHPMAPVVVELDGHDFHDKDKHQRAYEKSRDRFLVKRGFKVLHFTGSEVVADPHKVAFEALCVAGANLVRKEDEYDPQFPLGEL